MKRSEMLTIIEEAILDSYDYCFETGWSICVDSILGAIEEAGMKPPTNPNDSSFDLVMGKASSWEPENEPR